MEGTHVTQTDLFAARDAALDRHRSRHASLIVAATTFALRLAHMHGSVTSPEVLAAMRAEGWGDELDTANGRWMGSVLSPRCGWERTGEWVAQGSKARLVPRWRLKR